MILDELIEVTQKLTHKVILLRGESFERPSCSTGKITIGGMMRNSSRYRSVHSRQGSSQPKPCRYRSREERAYKWAKKLTSDMECNKFFSLLQVLEPKLIKVIRILNEESKIFLPPISREDLYEKYHAQYIRDDFLSCESLITSLPRKLYTNENFDEIKNIIICANNILSPHKLPFPDYNVGASYIELLTAYLDNSICHRFSGMLEASCDI